MVYHAVYIACPNCQVNAQTNRVSIREDLMLMLEGFCPMCQKELFLEIPFVETLNLACYQPRTSNLGRVH